MIMLFIFIFGLLFTNYVLASESNQCLDYTTRFIEGHFNYLGTHDTTSSGKPCNYWSRRSAFSFDNEWAEEMFLYCRQPESVRGERPWCFTSLPEKNDDWEYCNIPPCLITEKPVVISYRKRATIRAVEIPFLVDGNHRNGLNTAFCIKTLSYSRRKLYINFLENVNVQYVKLYNRQDCCQSTLNHFIISTSRSQTINTFHKCAFFDRSATPGEIIDLKCHASNVRYLRVELYNDAVLCEIDVFGYPHEAGFQPTLLSQYKNTYQSSTITEHTSNLAVDGSQNYLCSKTNIEVHPYWMVDLGWFVNIERVDINDGGELRKHEFTISTSENINGTFYQCVSYNTLWHRDRTWNQTINLACFANAIFLKIQLFGFESLKLCEVSIYGQYTIANEFPSPFSVVDEKDFLEIIPTIPSRLPCNSLVNLRGRTWIQDMRERMDVKSIRIVANVHRLPPGKHSVTYTASLSDQYSGPYGVCEEYTVNEGEFPVQIMHFKNCVAYKKRFLKLEIPPNSGTLYLCRVTVFGYAYSPFKYSPDSIKYDIIHNSAFSKVIDTSISPSECSHVDQASGPRILELDFQVIREIYSIRIAGANLTNIAISVSIDQIWYVHITKYSGRNMTINETINSLGSSVGAKYLRFEMNHNSSLVLCDLSIYGNHDNIPIILAKLPYPDQKEVNLYDKCLCNSNVNSRWMEFELQFNLDVTGIQIVYFKECTNNEPVKYKVLVAPESRDEQRKYRSCASFIRNPSDTSLEVKCVSHFARFVRVQLIDIGIIGFCMFNVFGYEPFVNKLDIVPFPASIYHWSVYTITVKVANDAGSGTQDSIAISLIDSNNKRNPDRIGANFTKKQFFELQNRGTKHIFNLGHYIFMSFITEIEIKLEKMNKKRKKNNLKLEYVEIELPSCLKYHIEINEWITDNTDRKIFKVENPYTKNKVTIISLNKQTSQSSTFHIYNSSLAVDGNYDREDFCTQYKEMKAWWKINFGELVDIRYVEILGGLVALPRVDISVAFANDGPFRICNSTVPTYKKKIKCKAYRVGVLKIDEIGFGMGQFSLCEVDVYGSPTILTDCRRNNYSVVGTPYFLEVKLKDGVRYNHLIFSMANMTQYIHTEITPNSTVSYTFFQSFLWHDVTHINFRMKNKTENLIHIEKITLKNIFYQTFYEGSSCNNESYYKGTPLRNCSFDLKFNSHKSRGKVYHLILAIGIHPSSPTNDTVSIQIKGTKAKSNVMVLPSIMTQFVGSLHVAAFRTMKDLGDIVAVEFWMVRCSDVFYLQEVSVVDVRDQKTFKAICRKPCGFSWFGQRHFYLSLHKIIFSDCFTSREGKVNVYEGTTNTTVGGLKCSRWDLYRRGNIRRYTTNEKIRSMENYCRIIKGDFRMRPWCYTDQSILIKTDYCDIPACI